MKGEYNMHNLKISSVKFLDNYQISILLCNGHTIIYNLEPKLNAIRFTDLAEKEVFCHGELINGKMIRWNRSTEISLEEILTQVLNESSYIKEEWI